MAKQIEALDATHADIRRALHMFWSLSGNNASADQLTLLGYFAVVECLLTHAPDAKDPTDSISRQIRAKMKLLGNRPGVQIDYSCFAQTEPGTAWSKLYALRSAIAHGSSPDFAKSLSLLKDKRTAATFMNSTCRALLRFALSDPVLCKDLKSC